MDKTDVFVERREASLANARGEAVSRVFACLDSQGRWSQKKIDAALSAETVVAQRTLCERFDLAEIRHLLEVLRSEDGDVDDDAFSAEAKSEVVRIIEATENLFLRLNDFVALLANKDRAGDVRELLYAAFNQLTGDLRESIDLSILRHRLYRTIRHTFQRRQDGQP